MLLHCSDHFPSLDFPLNCYISFIMVLLQSEKIMSSGAPSENDDSSLSSSFSEAIASLVSAKKCKHNVSG